MIVISGKSSSGKNYIVNKLKKVNGINFMVSTTTRPAREGEVDGVDYYFKSKKQFEREFKDGKLLMYRKYDTIYGCWEYGVNREEFFKDTPICIVDMEGLKELRTLTNDVTAIFIDCDEEIRLARAKSREDMDSEKLKEIARRFRQDDIDFSRSQVWENYDYILDNNTELDSDIIVKTIINILNYSYKGDTNE